MALKCPACEEAVPRSAVECPACGTELNPVVAPPPRPASDSTKYLVIVGGLIVAVAILVFVASGMQGYSCTECKGKGYILCLNCKGGTPKCKVCKGSGADPQSQSTCMSCNGTGTKAVCPNCNGQAKKACPTCGGTGQTK